MKMKVIVVLTTFFLLGINVDTGTAINDEKCQSFRKLDALPGNGWCSLRNIEMNPVFSITYNECRVLQTPTVNYLVPDHLHLIPRASSNLDTSGEIIDRYQNYESITSRSIGASVSAGYASINIGSSFSNEYQQMKKTQVELKTVTTRVSGRYIMHSARFDEYSVDIHPDLKVHLLDAIEAIITGNITRASLVLELAVLSHGTHVITGIDLGGVIAKEDYIAESYRTEYDMSQHILTISASIGFANYFKANVSYNQRDYNSHYNEYQKNIMSTKISCFGGEPFTPTSNVSTWVVSVPKYLVAVDRSGVTIADIITPRHFPNVNQSILSILRREYIEAIDQFNVANARSGCLDQYSANFDYNANYGDKQCTAPATSYALGGFFQSCYCRRTPGADRYNCNDKCSGYVRKNFLTDDTNCPSEYSAVYLNGKNFQECYDVCEYFLFWGTECHTYCVDYGYNAYWCAANSFPISNNSGLQFGGVFTSGSNNHVTGTKSCPPYFNKLALLTDLTVCASSDYEFGYKYSVPFGGMFSCHQGNPLASIANPNSKTQLQILAAKPTCGNGYSQHTAAIDDNCIIGYCVKANSFGSGHIELPIVLPPFQNYDVLFAQEALQSAKLVFDEKSIAVVVLGTLLGIVCVVFAFTVKLMRRSAYRLKIRSNNSTPLIVNHMRRDYKSI